MTSPGPGATALRSLCHYLNPVVVADTGLLDGLRQHLAEGRLIIVRHAFRPAFADRLHACLDGSSDWQLHEGDSHPHFRYRHHNLYDESRFPPDLRWCQAILQSAETKAFVQALSGRDCSGRGQFSASWYHARDYSLPHNDLVGDGSGERRQLAMVWHLTRDWQPRWGGDFYWCPAGRYVAPSFNTLLLFTVRRESAHFVTAVTPRARGKRLAINGWWTGLDTSDAPAPEGQPPVHPGRLIDVI
jgi:Rps23 Pro-64 3,4-dihydroxylase Tpa1-like proline 4-hydroxylase